MCFCTFKIELFSNLRACTADSQQQVKQKIGAKIQKWRCLPEEIFFNDLGESIIKGGTGVGAVAMEMASSLLLLGTLNCVSL